MKYANWDIRGFNRNAAVMFVRGGINPLVSVFLASRGFSNIYDARIMLGEEKSEFHDPFLMTDMEKAVDCIYSAIENNDKITIFGDYDVDGMTSSALLARWLRSKNAEFDIYIPARIDEGYGLSCSALNMFKTRGTKLVITVDCGVTAIKEAEYARELGMNLVITDHHECKSELPDADAVVDPKRPDCPYPNKTLAGVGVVFKLICALEKHIGMDELINKYCDLVAIGTVADVVSVTGENRELIRRGLALLNEGPILGIAKLLNEPNGKQNKIAGSTISFSIAPKLNAAGRMGKAMLSIELLLTEDEDEAERLATELSELNLGRRSIENEIFEEAIQMMSGSDPTGPIVLAKRGWHRGVIGIVASKMTEHYFLPAVMISVDEDGIGHGSCRSYGLFSMYDALADCEELLITYGGHDMATGISLAEENIGKLRETLNEIYSDKLNYMPSSGLRIDFEVEKPELLTVDNLEALAKLEPFGSGNPAPYMYIRDAFLHTVFSIGSGKHSRLRLEKYGQTLDCICFRTPPDKLGVYEGMHVDIAFEPQINDFRGRNVQLHVLDIRDSK